MQALSLPREDLYAGALIFGQIRRPSAVQHLRSPMPSFSSRLRKRFTIGSGFFIDSGVSQRSCVIGERMRPSQQR